MNPERTLRLSPRLLVGLLVIALGVVLLLDNLRLVYAEDVLRFFWPVVLLSFGVLKLQGSGGTYHRAIGIGIILVGLYLLLDALGLTPFYFELDDLWPLILVGVGAALVYSALHRGTARRDGGGADRRVNAFAVLGGTRLVSTSREFEGANLAAFAGGCELDLRGAAPAAAGAVIDAFVTWGGVAVWVPEDWTVTSRVIPLMGSFEDKTRPGAADPAKRLLLKGFVMMGGIEVANGPRGRRRSRES
jgi:LiaI-LiaF-like transmembrane region